MPLSEHEQRQLEQIEQALYREDRRLARLVRSSDPRVHYKRRVAEALVGLALGAAMIAAGIVLGVIGLAVAGFVILLLCGIWALNSWRQMATVALGAAQGARPVRTSAAPAVRGARTRRAAAWASGLTSAGAGGKREDARQREGPAFPLAPARLRVP